MESAEIDWGEIRLVVFDVDGTLYDQRRLRLRMLVELLRSAVIDFSADTLLTLREFRRCRERFADQPGDDFLMAQYAVPAARRDCTPEHVRALVAEWMDERPLAHLAVCRRPGIEALFDALRGAGKTIGILSDYPAREKLKAMGLTADFVVSSTDEDVARPKPDPAGLRKLMRMADAGPGETLMIGDRMDRDGEVARRSGVRARILTNKAAPSAESFVSFSDALFEPLLRAV